VSNQRIAIFGATSTIAAEVARCWAARGARLYLFARNAERLHALADELGETVVATACGDLDDLAANAARVERAIASLGGIDIALIAHGDLGDQQESERDLAAAESTLLTNLRSPVSLVIPLANALERQGRGKLAVLSSVAGDRGRPRNYTYGAAKSAVSVLLQGVRSRLYGTGVSVQDLRLGPVETPMTVDHQKNFSFSQPRDVARTIVAKIDRGAAIAYVPGWWRLVMAVVRWLPEPLFQRLRFLSAR